MPLFLHLPKQNDEAIAWANFSTNTNTNPQLHPQTWMFLAATGSWKEYGQWVGWVMARDLPRSLLLALEITGPYRYQIWLRMALLGKLVLPQGRSTTHQPKFS
jgi:hypothetical protein